MLIWLVHRPGSSRCYLSAALCYLQNRANCRKSKIHNWTQILIHGHTNLQTGPLGVALWRRIARSGTCRRRYTQIGLNRLGLYRMSSGARYTDKPKLITPSELISTLPSAFEQGLASGDLLFFESTTSKHSENGIEVNLRPYLLQSTRLCP